MKNLFKIFVMTSWMLCIISCEKPWYYDTGEKNEMYTIVTVYSDSLITGDVWPVIDYLNPTFNKNSSHSMALKSLATFSVNDGDPIKFEKREYSQPSYNYGFYLASFYPFKAGDKIDLSISYNDIYTPIRSTVIMPDKPEIQAEYIGCEENPRNSQVYDSLCVVKVKIKDAAAKKDYYMFNIYSGTDMLVEKRYNDVPNDSLLKTGHFPYDYLMERYMLLKQYGTLKDTVYWDHHYLDYFYSDEHFFINSNPSESEYYTNSLFDDSSFNGRDYEFIIKFPKYIRKQHRPSKEVVTDYFLKENKILEQRHYALLRIDKLSEDYYEYIKQTLHSSLAVMTVSNIQGGLGVFGAVNGGDIIRIDF